MTSLAHMLADWLNPLLFGLWFGLLFSYRNREGTERYLWSALVGLIAAVLLAEAGKHFVIWPGRPSFPSGHETLGTALATNCVVYDRATVWLVLPVCLILAWALVGAHYHRPMDVVGGLLLGPLVTLGAHGLFRTAGKRA